MPVPHRCPVCDGRGTLPLGFYARLAVQPGGEQEPCRACGGKGVLWDNAQTFVPIPVPTRVPQITDDAVSTQRTKFFTPAVPEYRDPKEVK